MPAWRPSAPVVYRPDAVVRPLLLPLILLSGVALAAPPAPIESVLQRDGDVLLLQLDDYASNAPLPGLVVRLLDAQGSRQAADEGEGRYRLPVEGYEPTRSHPLRLAVSGPALDLQLAVEMPPAAVTPEPPARLPRWPWLLLLALFLPALLVVLRRQRA